MSQGNIDDADDDIIRAGDYVIVRSYDDKSSYIVLCEGEKKINKSRISMKEIVGHHYDQIFELNNRKFHAVSVTEQIATEYYDPDHDPNNATANVVVSCHSVVQHSDRGNSDTELGIYRIDYSNRVDDEGKADPSIKASVIDSTATSSSTVLQYINNISLRGNNSYYTDTNTAQKLSNDDIKRLKEQGLSGRDIIQNLIEHSDTFANKNEYAQEKWLKKKDNKYRRKYKVRTLHCIDHVVTVDNCWICHRWCCYRSYAVVLSQSARHHLTRTETRSVI